MLDLLRKYLSVRAGSRTTNTKNPYITSTSRLSQVWKSLLEMTAIYFLLSSQCFLLAADKVDIPVNEVLLFRDRTQVTRTGKLKFEPGENQFLLESLSPLLFDESLRGYTDNPQLSITSIITFVEPGSEYKDKEYATLKKEMDTIESKKKQLDGKRGNLINERNVLDEYRKLTGETVSKKAAYINSSEDLKLWKETLTYFQTRSIQIGNDIQKTEFEMEDLAKKSNEISLKLNKIISSAGKSKRIVEVRISNSSNKRIESEFSLSYLIGNSSWIPAYNIIWKGGDATEVEYLAEIRQETGEDWKDVKVALSTAEPKKSSTRPRVQSVEVFTEGGKTKKTFFSFEKKESAAPVSSTTDVVNTAKEVDGIVQEGAGGFIFRSSERAKIPSKKESSRITISRFQTEMKTALMTVPHKQRLIYTAGDLYNKISFPLLAGKAAIYKNSGFIGETNLPYTPSGARVKISMGIENDIRVFYRVESSNFKDGFVKTKQAFEKTNYITLESFSNKEEEVIVWDRIPVSEIADVDVEIDDKKTTPNYTWKEDKSGILFWKIKLSPRKKVELELRFRIKVPNDSGLSF